MIGFMPRMGLNAAAVAGWSILYTNLPATTYPADIQDGDVALFTQAWDSTSTSNLGEPAGATTINNTPYNYIIEITGGKIPRSTQWYSRSRLSWRALTAALAGATVGGASAKSMAILRPSAPGTPVLTTRTPQFKTGLAPSFNQTVDYGMAALPFMPLLWVARHRSTLGATALFAGAPGVVIASAVHGSTFTDIIAAPDIFVPANLLVNTNNVANEQSRFIPFNVRF